MIADQFIETTLWDLLWARVSQSLKPQTEEQDLNQQDDQMVISEPDWTFFSPGGFISVLNLTSRMLTMSTQNCITLFVKDDSIMYDSLSYMLSDHFLSSLKKTYENNESMNKSLNFKDENSSLSGSIRKKTDLDDEDSVEYLISEFILTICQILCFPFAIDSNEEVISRMYNIIKEFNLFSKILYACTYNVNYLTCDIPMSLIARLVLTDDDLVQLLIDQLNNSPKVSRILLHYHSIKLILKFCYFIQIVM